MKPRACVFDAYGTLFDIHSVVRREGLGICGDLEALSRLWRQRQVEYTWRRALMQRYQDFWHITQEALRAAVEELRIAAEEAQLARLMQAYLSPEVFSDVVPALDALGAEYPLAILSNGSRGMLSAAVQYNGLEPRFRHVLSVDGLKTYKPAPVVYALGPEALGTPAEEILFVSSNAWDVSGAKGYGYQVCWCNRSNEPRDGLEFQPDLIVNRLDQIVSKLG